MLSIESSPTDPGHSEKKIDEVTWPSFRQSYAAAVSIKPDKRCSSPSWGDRQYTAAGISVHWRKALESGSWRHAVNCAWSRANVIHLSCVHSSLASSPSGALAMTLLTGAWPSRVHITCASRGRKRQTVLGSVLRDRRAVILSTLDTYSVCQRPSF